jgi:transcriptional regulator with XRE-family HTH domain
MAKASTTAADVGSLGQLRPAIQKMVDEQRWKQRLAKDLQGLRKQSGLSIQQVAKRARVPVATIQRLENASPNRASVAQLMRIVHSVGGMFTGSRVARRWLALLHKGRIIEETFAVDEAEALSKLREMCGKLIGRAAVEKPPKKNSIERRRAESQKPKK